MKSKNKKWCVFVADNQNISNLCYVLESENSRLSRFLNSHVCSKKIRCVLGCRMKFFGDLIADLRKQQLESIF